MVAGESSKDLEFQLIQTLASSQQKEQPSAPGRSGKSRVHVFDVLNKLLCLCSIRFHAKQQASRPASQIGQN